MQIHWNTEISTLEIKYFDFINDSVYAVGWGEDEKN
jgi:hypothetical protein